MGPSINVAEQRLEELYAREYSGLLRLATALLGGDVSSAEDIVHDSFIGLRKRWSPIDTVRSHEAYLRKSVVNGTRSLHRRNGSVRNYLAKAVGGALGGSNESEQRTVERRLLVFDSVHQLPRRQREVLFLRFWADLPFREIAELLNISVSTATSTAVQALARLRQILGDP